MSWREQRDAARQAVHETFKVAAYYIASLPYLEDSNSEGALTTLYVRVHDRIAPTGENPEVEGWATKYDFVPKVIALRADLTEAGITLQRGNVFSIATGEAYIVDLVRPHDNITVTAEVSRLTDTEAAGLPVPD